MGARETRLTTVIFDLDGQGMITGLIHEPPSADLVGAVQGGTGRFTGALGTFRQLGMRSVFDLLLPNVGAAAAAPAQVPGQAQDAVQESADADR
jgi:hypothetical protein